MLSYRKIIDEQRMSLYESFNENENISLQLLSDRSEQTSSRSIASSPTEDSGKTHTHEFISSTKLAGENDDRHNHRFTGVTSEVIPIKGGSHKHIVSTLTDFFGHLHEVTIETGPAIDVGHGKHVHFASGETTLNDGHLHEYAFTTLIEAPLL